jgi:hypothetical protein
VNGPDSRASEKYPAFLKTIKVYFIASGKKIL